MMALRALLLLAVAVLHAWAQQTVTAPHPLTNLPPAGLITTGVFFPEHPKLHFAAGKPVKAVLGIHNDASETYNVTAILGSVNSPSDFRMHFQNFTEQVYHQTVAAGGELSLEYKFLPDPRIDPMSLTLALTVFYHDAAGKYFSNTFFNQTIEIVEVKKVIDWELLGLFVLLAGLAGALIYLAWGLVAPFLLTNFGIGRKKAKKAEGPKVDDQDEWVKGSNYDNFKKKQAAKRLSPVKKAA